jgi:hypothetical protein
MIGNVSAGPLRAFVKVADCYDPSSTGTLTCVKKIKICVESAFATVCVRFVLADCFICFGEHDQVEFALHQVA